MKLSYFVLGLFLLPSFAFAGDISGISFTNEPVTAGSNEPAKLTINLQYEGGSHPTACMLMATDSGTGQFSSNDTNWESVDKLTVNSNWANKNFYYKDTIEGNYTLNVGVVSVACSSYSGEETEWTTSQNITIGSGSSNAGSSSSDSDWPEYVPPEDRPKFTAYAGKDVTLVAGAYGEFRGEGYDFDNNLIENGRYLWNFGDGSMKEGRNVSYFYRFPGEYIVTLDVSSGKNSASDRLLVKVIPNEIVISEVKLGAESFVELYNGSKEEINLSGWQMRSGRQIFNLPKNTFIKPLGYSVFPVSFLGMLLPLGAGKVELLYQTGSLATSFLYSGVLDEGQSFNCPTSDVGQVYMVQETPGEKNVEPKFSEENLGIQNLPNYSNPPNSGDIKDYEPEIKDKEEKQAMATGTESLPAEVSTKAGLEANVINATDSEPGKNSMVYYLLAVGGLIFFSALGLVFVRRNSSL